MAYLTALPTEHVCVASGQLVYRHLQYLNSLVISGAWSCGCCYFLYGWNKRRLEHLETHGTPLREPVERCNFDCLLCFLLGPAGLALEVRLSITSP
jgi:hypothetical protein